MDCLFCKIAEGSIESDVIYKDDQVIVISDIHPYAPIHKLIIPRKHIATLNDVNESDTQLLGLLVQTAQKTAKNLGISESGYRLVFNTNRDAGQVIFHIHLHLLGGEHLGHLVSRP